MNHLVSVTIFAYNHEDYIARTIESVINQKCTFDFKIYICNDCSRDKTNSIIMDYYSRYKDLIVPVINETNLGLNKSFEKVIALLSSKYIAVLGGDDYWIIEDKLQRQVELMENNDKISFVHTEYISFLEKTNIFKKHQNSGWKWLQTVNTTEDKIARFISHKWTGYPLSSSSCFRLNILLQGIKKFPDLLLNDFLPGEGTIVHISMAYFGNEYAFLPIETTIYTVRESSLSHKKSNEQQFLFHMRYAKLRLYVAEKFGLGKKIELEIMNQVLLEAIRLNQKEQFKEWVINIHIPDDLKRKYIKSLNYNWFYSSIKLFIQKVQSVCYSLYDICKR